MALKGLSIMDNSTGLSVTGGAGVTFTETSVAVAGGVNVADHSQADFRLRRHITFRNRNPVRQNNGDFSKAKRSFVFTTPVEDSDGVIRYITTRWEQETPVEASAAAELNHRRLAAQIQFDADVEAFHTTGSVA